MSNEPTQTAIDWNAVWVAMQELGAAISPVLDTRCPPSWAVSLRFVMDAASEDVAERCDAQEAESNG